MAIGVIGRKCGMTRVFTEEGISVPVTVIEVTPNRVSQVKTEETDGYEAVQVTVGERHECAAWLWLLHKMYGRAAMMG